MERKKTQLCEELTVLGKREKKKRKEKTRVAVSFLGTMLDLVGVRVGKPLIINDT